MPRASRLIVLEAGETLELGAREQVQALRFTAVDDLIRQAGRALADYRYQCCEQTAAATIGAWATLFQFNGPSAGVRSALGAIWEGLNRLESMWRGNGFALYPALASASRQGGYLAYLHLLAMRRWARALRPSLMAAARPTVEALEKLLSQAAAVYGGIPDVRNCHEAWLAGQGEGALRFAQERWTRMPQESWGPVGCVPVAGDAVATRAETCYAGAVLLAEAGETSISDVRRTLGWLGGQLEEGGRLYSTTDSSALLALLWAAVPHFSGRGMVRLDDGRPLSVEAANRAVAESLPRRVTCTEGQLQLLIDEMVTSRIGDREESSALRVRIESDGLPTKSADLGRLVELTVDVGSYEIGDLVHIALPPCLAHEDGGVRLQVFQRDFEGHPRLKIPLRAVERTEGAHWHGLVALRNMYRQERKGCVGVEMRVEARR